MWDLEVGLQSLGGGVWGSEIIGVGVLGVRSLEGAEFGGCRVWVVKFGAQSLGVDVQGLGFRFQEKGCRG